MDYRDANTIEQDRRTHYNRTFGGRAPTTPVKLYKPKPVKHVNVHAMPYAHKMTATELANLDKLYNG